MYAIGSIGLFLDFGYSPFACTQKDLGSAIYHHPNELGRDTRPKWNEARLGRRPDSHFALRRAPPRHLKRECTRHYFLSLAACYKFVLCSPSK